MKSFLFFLILYNISFSAPIKLDNEINPQKRVREILKMKNLPSNDKFILLNKYKKYAFQELQRIYNDEKEDFKVRWLAVMNFARLYGKEKSFDVLKIALKHNQWFIRSAAAKAFGFLHCSKAISLLVSTLNDKSLIVRTSAVDAMAQIGDKSTIEPMMKALYDPINFNNGKGLWIRNHIVDAIMKMGDKDAIRLLISFLNDTDERLVLRAMKNLNKITGVNFEYKYLADNITGWKNWYSAKNDKVFINNKNNILMEINR